MELTFVFKKSPKGEEMITAITGIFFTYHHSVYIRGYASRNDFSVLEKLPFDNLKRIERFKDFKKTDSCLIVQFDGFDVYCDGFALNIRPHAEKLYPHYWDLFRRAVIEKTMMSINEEIKQGV
jgi:hypothetical protein